jgi:hypothetical protein
MVEEWTGGRFSGIWTASAGDTPAVNGNQSRNRSGLRDERAFEIGATPARNRRRPCRTLSAPGIQ